MPDHAPRAIRVFVSSTFRDFIAERDRLARFGFRALRRLCAERAVVFTDVDLRWGITDEQAAEGEVLPICLAEIEASRPFFVGLLGERYGWVPERIDGELIERQPWLAEHAGRSVTELEMVHGVLNDPAMAARSYFYFRDPEASRALGVEGEEENAAAAERLAGLKARIRASGLPVREGFQTPEELAAAVLADLTAALDAVYPADAVPDALERERLAQTAFGDELVAGFVPRPELQAALDAHASGEGPPLLVTGASGSGKSALLAHWAREGARPHPPVIVHYCGASAASSDWVALVRRVAGELGRETGVTAELPDAPGELKGAFKNLLFRAAAAKPYVLLLDGVDQLEERDGALDLSFLPPVVPAGCRLILSAASGTAPAREAERRGWESLVVGELGPRERPKVLASLLSCRAKRLDPVRADRICAAAAAANPLSLSVLVDELSVVGSHQVLDQTLARYLEVDTPEDLYERVLERYEGDYEARPGLVVDAMRAIWASRRGIAEHELLAVLGKGEPLPAALLAPLLHAAGRQIGSRGGRLTFAHALLRQAVADRYLPDDESRRSAHRTLVELFARDRMSPRSVDELPWQLLQAREWDRLVGLLVEVPFLEVAWGADKHEVLRAWAVIERESIHRIAEAYREAVAGAKGERGELTLAVLMYETGHLGEASALFEKMIARCRELGDPAGLQVSLGNQALILQHHGELDRAMTLLKEQERLCRELGDPAVLQASLGNQALILKAYGDPDGAMTLHKQEERLCRELGDPAGLQASLGNQALILQARGDPDGAMKLLKENERLCRELGDPAGLSRSLGNQALILQDHGDLDGAMTLHKEQERLSRELGDPVGLHRGLGNQALILMARGDLDGAMTLLKEQERLCRDLGDPAGLHASLGNQALILKARGDLDGAMRLHKEEERLCRELGDQAGLQVSLGNQALILQDRGDRDGAMKLHEEEERLCRELGDPAGLHRSLGNQALILRARGNLDGAMRLHKEEERLCRELGDPAGLHRSLGNQALILQARGDLDGAMKLHREKERLCRELGDPAGLAIALHNRTNCMLAARRPAEALPLIEEAVTLARRLGSMHLAAHEALLAKVRAEVGHNPPNA